MYLKYYDPKLVPCKKEIFIEALNHHKHKLKSSMNAAALITKPKNLQIY